MLYRRVFGLPTLRLRSPFDEIERMRRQMDRLMEGFLGHGPERRFAGVFPLINLTEDNNNFYVRAELPGVFAEDLDIQATASGISISGERKILSENDNAKYHRRERTAGKFSRILDLPKDVDPEKIEARMVDGILTVVIPKAERAKPRQIAVK